MTRAPAVMLTQLEAFRMLEGPCHGEVAELPTGGYDQVWRMVRGASELTYALYARDGAVYRYAGRTLTEGELLEGLPGKTATWTVHADSREYER